MKNQNKIVGRVASNNNWEITYTGFEEDKKFWKNETFIRLEKILFNKFKHYTEEEWQTYKSLNEIKKSKPKKIIFSWDTLYEKNIEQKSVKGSSTIDLPYHDEENKVVIIKDPIIGISWDCDEPKEGEWISVPEKLAEKLITMESFKN